MAFPKSRFEATRHLWVVEAIVEGTECVEVRVASDSPGSSTKSRRFIDARRKKAAPGFSDLTIGVVPPEHTTKAELQQAEVLRLVHDLPTLRAMWRRVRDDAPKPRAIECNWGRQVSDLILDTRRVPQHKDISETIAWVEWVASSKFVRAITENKLTGAEFRPIFEFKNPTKQSRDWHQLRVTGKVGGLAETTKLGSDPFSPSQVSWVSARALNSDLVSLEIYLHRNAWDASDIVVSTSAMFGQGRTLLRPIPLIIVLQRLYRGAPKRGRAQRLLLNEARSSRVTQKPGPER